MKIDEYRISNLDTYLGRMQKGIIDKLFFIDKVYCPFENIIDFGCANGELIRAIYCLFGDSFTYYGYDINIDMLEAAKKHAPFAHYLSDWDMIDVDKTKSLLNISSTTHEIYSYCDQKSVNDFWNKVFDGNFKYITIRDMMISDSCEETADEEMIKSIYAEEKHRSHLIDYENVWGKIKTKKDLLHYLLKYDYDDNWDREVRENYLGLNIEHFLSMIPDKYEVTYFDHYTLPYIQWKVQKDFGINLKEKTHIKIILKLK